MALQWSDLGVDLLTMIEERVVLYVDKVRFKAVCKSWNYILPKLPNHQNKKLPWLFHRVYDNKEASHGLFDPLENKLYLLDLPEIEEEEEDQLEDEKEEDNNEGMSLIGSSNGWVAYFYRISPDRFPYIFLMNPLTRSQVKLPSLNKFHNHHDLQISDVYIRSNFVGKVVLSSSPLKHDCAVFVTYNGVRYCKPNDEKWSPILGLDGAVDVVFHKGKLHALLYGGELVVLENINPTRLKRIASKLTITTSLRGNNYLVESSDGELMMVVRGHFRGYSRDQQIVDCFGKTPRFEVYKHDPTNLRWFMVKNIGDEVIFLQHSSSMSMSCRDCPGFKGNRIYFSETLCFYDDSLVDIDIIVFNLDDETCESFSVFKHKYDSFSPVWFTPSLN